MSKQVDWSDLTANLIETRSVLPEIGITQAQQTQAFQTAM